MDWIEKQLSHAQTPNTITHLGAGLCSELESYLLHNPGQICLVEPNPEVLPELRRRAAQDQRIGVIPIAVSGREGRRALKLFNYPDLASLRQPTGLIQLLPGLRQTGQAIVDVLAARALPEHLQLDADGDNWLIIDTPGEEFAIIEGLAKHQQLHYFDRIVLKAGSESLYENAQSAEDIVAYLQRLGYFDEGAPDNADADWPRLHLRLNPKAPECERLKQDNSRLQEQISSLQSERKEQERQRVSLEEKLKATKEECEAARTSGSDHAKKLKAAQQELQKTRDELEKLKKQKAEQQSDLNARIEKLKKQLNEQKEQFDKHVAGLQQQVHDQRTRLAHLESERTTLDEITEVRRLLSNQSQQMQQLPGRLGDDLAQLISASARQIQAYSRLERELQDDQLLRFVQPGSIDPDLALYLLRRIEDDPIDLVVQFGSGELTLILAAAMQKCLDELKIGTKEGESSEKTGRLSESQSSGVGNNLPQRLQRRFLPTPVLGFEHDRSHFDRMVGELQRAGLDDLVDLEYAPLTDDHDADGGHCLFYSCSRALARAGESVATPGRHVLVIVESSGRSPEDFSAYPALVHVLNQLHSCASTVVFCDSSDIVRQRVVEEWETLLERRAMKWQEEFPLTGLATSVFEINQANSDRTVKQ